MHVTARAVLASTLLSSALGAQDSMRVGFFRKGDGKIALAAVAATVAAAAFDERIARWTRQPGVQGDSGRHDAIKAVTVVNEMPLTVAAVLTYGIGRLSGSPTIADVGLHLTEALVTTELVAEGMRVAIGRVRPRASQSDAFSFGPGKGFSQFEYRAFPSLHAAVAFTTAAVLSQEIRMRNPSASKYATPLLYTAAMIPGLTRLYLDQHWASDVVAGTILGAYIGTRVVQYTHGRRTRIDRALLGMTVAPDGHGGTNVGLQRRF
jgi:hypothetical protein